MTRIKIMGLSLMAVFAVFALSASMASAKTVLTLKTAKGPLAAGANITASSGDLIFTTEAGNLECTSNVISGTLANNSGTKDKGSATSESSTGGEAGGLCKTTTPFGPAEIVSSGFPWPIEFTTKGTATVKGSKKVQFTSTFPAAGGAKCEFEASKVVSSFNATAGSGPITLTTTSQLFKINKKTSNPACPKTGTLSGHFTLTSSGEAIED